MHCPRCGEQQSSNEIRFCRKCGLAMDDVKEILAPEGFAAKKPKKSTTGSAVRQGLGLVLFGFVLVALLAILRDLNLVPQVFVKIAALVFCVGGAIRMAYPYAFGKDVSSKTENTLLENDEGHRLEGNISTNKLLPQAQFYPPINSVIENYDTAEILSPPSVTEDSTRLLKNQLMQE